jgi:PAS domain S-box-containing protein
MRKTSAPSSDDRDHQRDLRDLSELVALPALRGNAEPRQIAEGLAGALMKLVSPDFAYIRLQGLKVQDRLDVVRVADHCASQELNQVIRAALKSNGVFRQAGATALPLPAGPGSMRGILAPIGEAGELGFVLAASGRSSFPAEGDFLLLEVAAAQAAASVQRLRMEEAKGLLAAIVESSQDAIVSKTLEGVITSWNSGAERLFEYTAKEAIGQHISLIIPPERRHEEEQILERLRRGLRIECFETVRRARSGRLIDISLTVSPLRDPSGRVVGASKVARDITAQKAAEKAIRDAGRQKDEFLATLAHELRNPLAPLRNSAEIIRSFGSASPELTALAGTIDRQVRQLARLVDDLLEISRITQGRIVLHKTRFDLASVVESAVEEARPLIQESGHRLSIMTPDPPLTVEADPARLAQILSNLLTNSARYMKPGGDIRLEIGASADELSLRVIDTGVGIPKDMLPRIFEPFGRIGPSLEASSQGLGLGLALVHRLVGLHGGTVEVRSEGPGRGSEFIVRLPLIAGSALEKAAVSSRKRSVPAREFTKRRVLVVDDNEDAADTLATLLRMMGHEVYLAHDGLAAVEKASELRPEMAFLDIGLPALNGYEAARRIRSMMNDKITLIALTGWAQEQDRLRSADAGFDLHLAKPVELETLLSLMEHPAGVS